MSRNFIRERKMTCGNRNYMSVDIFPYSNFRGETVSKKRKKRENVACPAQRNLNDKNKKKYFRHLINGNFDINDYFLTLTFSTENRPGNPEKLEKEARNWLDRCRRAYQKADKEFKYVLVTHYTWSEEEQDWETKPHFHVLVGDGLSRDEIEDTWSKGRGKNRKRIGLVQSSRLQYDPDKLGFNSVADYILRKAKGTKQWKRSSNLKKPYCERDADFKHRKTKIDKLAVSNDKGYEYFREKFPNYYFSIDDIEYRYYEETGWHVSIQMWKIQNRR